MFGRKQLGRHNRSLLASTCHSFKPQVCASTRTHRKHTGKQSHQRRNKINVAMADVDDAAPSQRSHQTDFGCVHSSIAI